MASELGDPEDGHWQEIVNDWISAVMEQVLAAGVDEVLLRTAVSATPPLEVRVVLARVFEVTTPHQQSASVVTLLDMMREHDNEGSAISKTSKRSSARRRISSSGHQVPARSMMSACTPTIKVVRRAMSPDAKWQPS